MISPDAQIDGFVLDRGRDERMAMLAASPVAACSARAKGAAAAAIVSPPRSGARRRQPAAVGSGNGSCIPATKRWSLPYGRPSKFEANVVRRYRQGLPEPPTRLSSFSLTPLQDLHGIITPNGLHFERHHAGARRSTRLSIG